MDLWGNSSRASETFQILDFVVMLTILPELGRGTTQDAEVLGGEKWLRFYANRHHKFCLAEPESVLLDG